jgi:hypothetical protein
MGIAAMAVTAAATTAKPVIEKCMVIQEDE